MNDSKYIGLDAHQATISVAVLDSSGKLVMEAVLGTKAETILQFIHGLRGTLRVTLEEGTCAAWLHDVLKPHVAQVLVCDPRKNTLIKSGNKSDRIDARKLADLLYLDKLHPVFHGETGNRALKELLQMLKQYLGDRTTGRLFQARDGNPARNQQLNAVLGWATAQLSIERGTMHAFRHGRNSHMRQNGVPQNIVQDQVGHQDRRTNDLYTHNEEAFIRDTMEKLAGSCIQTPVVYPN